MHQAMWLGCFMRVSTFCMYFLGSRSKLYGRFLTSWRGSTPRESLLAEPPPGELREGQKQGTLWTLYAEPGCLGLSCLACEGCVLERQLLDEMRCKMQELSAIKR